MENEKWVKFDENSVKSDEAAKKSGESSEEESEEDENTTDEQRKERMFRKRKCQPGWTKANYFNDPETGKHF